MVRQRVKLYQYDWDVEILYDVHPKNANEILDILWSMGCPRQHMGKAERLLKSGIPNEGLTYSDRYGRRTLIVVGHATNLFTAFNTLEHEVNHLEMHICETDGIDPYSEQASYLAGDIKEAIARNAYHTMRRLFLSLI